MFVCLHYYINKFISLINEDALVAYSRIRNLCRIQPRKLSPDGVFSRVPATSAGFWAAKVCATIVGQGLSECFEVPVGLGLGRNTALFFSAFVFDVGFQLVYPKYVPAAYWMGIVLASICGAIVTDGFHDNLGISLWIECVVGLFVLACSFAVWYRVEGSIQTQYVTNVQRATCYWTTVFFCFCFSCAIGDAIAETTAWNYGTCVALYTAILGFTFIVWLGDILLYTGIQLKICYFGSRLYGLDRWANHYVRFFFSLNQIDLDARAIKNH